MSKEEFSKVYDQLTVFRKAGTPEKGAQFVALGANFIGSLHDFLSLEGVCPAQSKECELRKTDKFAAMEEAEVAHSHSVDVVDVLGNVVVDRGSVKAHLPTGEKSGK